MFPWASGGNVISDDVPSRSLNFYGTDITDKQGWKGLTRNEVKAALQLSRERQREKRHHNDLIGFGVPGAPHSTHNRHPWCFYCKHYGPDVVVP